MSYQLEFEKPVLDLQQKIQALRVSGGEKLSQNILNEIKDLEARLEVLVASTYESLSYWEKVQISRHPDRPHFKDYLGKGNVIEEFHEISGDRSFSNDLSIMTGFGRLSGEKVAIIGIEKGRKTQERISRNFGMPNPEGYKKALRLGELASRFNVPLLTFIDTPGAYPGIEAEERGQAHAIAQNLEKFFDFNCPIISTVIGEGGSGGALGIAIADCVLMQDFSTYSVISPESCASILWMDPKRADEAAASLKLDAKKALELKVIDKIIKEPVGGAHRDYSCAQSYLKEALLKELTDLKTKSIDELKDQRFARFRKVGNQTLKVIK